MKIIELLMQKSNSEVNSILLQLHLDYTLNFLILLQVYTNFTPNLLWIYSTFIQKLLWLYFKYLILFWVHSNFTLNLLQIHSKFTPTLLQMHSWFTLNIKFYSQFTQTLFQIDSRFTLNLVWFYSKCTLILHPLYFEFTPIWLQIIQIKFTPILLCKYFLLFQSILKKSIHSKYVFRKFWCKQFLSF